MKAKEYGPKYYLVKIYYKDQKGVTKTHVEWYCRKELANRVVKYLRHRRGTHYKDVNICGTIINAFSFAAKQCKFED